MTRERAAIATLLEKADIRIGGDRPWDIRVLDERLYGRVLAHGSLGLGEAYMEGWWECDRVDLFIERLLRAGKRANEVTLSFIWLSIKMRLFNLQSRRGARRVIGAHYDLSNELYASFLDPRMQYSCAYFKDTEDLDTAQEQKLDLICRKLQLKPSDRLLDIGCGWGGLARYAHERFGCTVVGITLSHEQARYAREQVAGLPIEIRVQDYRDLPSHERYDKIVSVGMFEHVGVKNYRTLFEIVAKALEDDGLFLLHTIGQNASIRTGNPWVEKYIFPGGMLPSVAQIGKACEELFVVEDWHNFGPYYHQTLRAWDLRFQEHWGRVKGERSETFYRMFRYYFNSFAGAFKARRIQLWQVVLSKGGQDSVYQAVR